MPVGVNLMEAQYYTGLPKTGSMTGTAEMDCNDITTVHKQFCSRIADRAFPSTKYVQS